MDLSKQIENGTTFSIEEKSELINAIIDFDMDNLTFDIEDILRVGRKGYEDMTDEELIDEFNPYVE